MADEQPSDEQQLYAAFQQLADAVLPLKRELRERALTMLAAFVGRNLNDGSGDAGATRPAGHRSPPPFQIASREPPSPKEFLFQKQPNTDLERVACLAYYLTHYRNTSHFKTIDISKLNTEAAQRKFANAASSVYNATQRGFLAAAPKGTKQLAAIGEQFVDALPDQAAAKAALGSRRKTRRQQRKTGKVPTATQEQAE